MLNDTDITWLAGLLEGEGSFMMGRNIVSGKVYRYPRVVVSMTDQDIIDRVAVLLGTKTYVIPNKNDSKKQQWRAQVNGSKAALLMEELLPYMGLRRAGKIKEILDEYGDIEPTSIRRSRSCSEAQKKRWKIYGTRSGRLPV